MKLQQNLSKILIALMLALSVGSLAVPFSTAHARSVTQETPTYTVQRGDTLSQIAQRFDTSIAVIRDANGITNADRIYVGQELLVPPRDWPGHAPVPPEAVSGEGNVTRVQFAPGSSNATLRNSVRVGNQDRYVLRARAGQEMYVTLVSDADNALFTFSTPNGEELVNPSEPTMSFVGTLPATGDYVITVGATGDTASYTLDVDILSSASPETPTGTTTYTVQRGDTLSRIAQRFNTTASAIQRTNGLVNANRIYVGQVLTIPVSHTPVPPEAVASQYTGAERVQFATGKTRQALRNSVAQRELYAYVLRASGPGDICDARFG